MNSKTVRWLKLLFGFAIAVGFAWLLARGLDLDALGRAFTGLSIPVVLLALVFLAAGWTIRIVRWWWMLRVFEPTLPLGACAGPFLAGMAVNNVLPFRAGDALRVLGFRRQLRSPAMRVAGTLVIERVLDVSILVGVFFLGLLSLPAGVFPKGFVVAVTWVAGVGSVATLALLLFFPALDRLRERLSGRGFLATWRWPKAVARHGVHLAETFSLVRSPQRMLILIGLSIVAWICEGALFAVLAAAIVAGVAPLGPWFALATGTLATVIPSTPGHLGTFDYFAAQGLAAYGASPEHSVAFALTVHAMLWASSTTVGLLCLLRSWASANPTVKGTIPNR